MDEAELLQKFLYGDQPNAFSADGVVNAVGGLPLKGVQVQKSMSLPVDNELVAKQLQSYQEQAKGIKAFEDALNKKNASSNNPWVAAVAGLSDIFNGTQQVPALMQQQAKKEEEGLKNQVLLQNMRNNLTDNELKFLREQDASKKDAQKLSLLFANKNRVADERTQRIESGLFSEWQKNPITKNSQDVATSYEKINSAVKNPTPAGDISLVYNVMKMFDPGSTVREGEFATAQNASGVPDRIMNMYNKIRTGQRLNPTQREEFTGVAEKMFVSQLAQQKRWDNTVKERAKKLGLNPNNIVLGETLFGDTYSKEPKDTAINLPPDKMKRYEELLKKRDGK